MENMLFVAYDCCSPDTAILSIARREAVRGIDKIRVVNTIRGEQAIGAYHLLTGQADLIQKHGHWYTLTDCANAGTYCSVCNKKVYKEHYANVKEKSRFCPNCGSINDGKFRIL